MTAAGTQIMLTSFPKDHRINKRANIVMRPKPFGIIRNGEHHKLQTTCEWEINTDFHLSSWCFYNPGCGKSRTALGTGEKGHGDEVQRESPPERERQACTIAHTTHSGLRPGSSQHQPHVKKGLKGERDPGPRKLVLLEEKEGKKGVGPGWWRTLEGEIEDTAHPRFSPSTSTTIIP